MTTDASVKLLHSNMTGAPVLTGQAGALTTLLDACLVNGWGLGNCDSIVIAGGIGTVTRSAGHPFEAGAVATIAGATVTGGSINGDVKVLSVPSSTTWTFDAGALANQTATGSPTAKLAGAGWAKSFSGTNLAAYKSTDGAATGCYLRVDDSGSGSASYARVVGYETMSDVNTGTGPFPTSAQQSGGGYWHKSTSADSTARPWVFFGDGRFFHLLIGAANATSAALSAPLSSSQAFGDIVAVKSPDAYACVLAMNNSSSYGTPGNNNVDLDYSDTSNSSGFYAARLYTGVGAAVPLRKVGVNPAAMTAWRSGNAGFPYPNSADGGIYVTPVQVLEHTTLSLRGAVPGLMAFPHLMASGGAVFNNRDSLTGVTGYAGKTFRVLNSYFGLYAVDVTGPWR